MKLLVIVAIMLAVVLLGWTASSLYFVWGIEEPDYEVVERRDGYEIRRYAPLLVAQTRAAPGDEQNDLFRVLAGYIFGGNEDNQAIAMTAPVLMTDSSTSGEARQASTMSFMMPSDYSRGSLPRPEDPRVSFKAVPGRTVAALEYSWYASVETRRERAGELVQMLDRDGVEPVGELVYAGYQPPFSAPFMMRHEVLVEVTAH